MSDSPFECPGWPEYSEESARMTVERRCSRDGLIWSMAWCHGHWHVYKDYRAEGRDMTDDEGSE